MVKLYPNDLHVAPGQRKKFVGVSKDDFHDLPCYRLASLQEDHG